MSLSMLNETMETVTDMNPLVSEHNGTRGETVEKHVFIANQTDDTTFREILVNAVNTDDDVRVSVSRMREVFSESVDLPDLPPGTEASIYIRIEVPPNSPEKVLNANMIQVSSTRFGGG